MELEDELKNDFIRKGITSSVGLDIVVVCRLNSSDKTPLIRPRVPSQSQEAVRKRGNSKGGASTSIEAVEKPLISFAKVERSLLDIERRRGDEIVKIRTHQNRSPGESVFILRRILFLRANTVPRAPPSIEDVAKDLLKKLIDIRRNCPERPIVFIGHNVGVVVIERALMESSNGDLGEAQVFRRTAGVIYLSSNVPEHQLKSERRSEYFDFPGRMISSQVKFEYKETHGTKYFEKHLSDFRARLKEANRTALDNLCSAGSFEKDTRPSAIMLFPPSSIGGLESARISGSRILEAIAGSLNCYRLLSAACKDNVEELRSILADGINVNGQDRNGNTALHIAASTGHMETVKMLLVDYEANVALQNLKGESALDLAVDSRKSNVEVAKLLLKKGAKFKDKGENDLPNLPRDSGEIKTLLENPPFIEGPQEDSKQKVWQIPSAPRSASAQVACHSSRAVVAEIFKIGEQEKLVLEDPTMDELLYKIGPEEILAKARSRPKGKDSKEKDNMENDSKCRWYHIPANNVSYFLITFYGRD